MARARLHDLPVGLIVVLTILVIVLAAAGFAKAAIAIVLLALVAAPEGIAHIHADHPDVHVVCAAVDRGLNERGYIVPGLGDAGDRLYGTK